MASAVAGGPGRRALIFAAGRLGDPERIRRLVHPRPDDLIICADAGAAHALALGLRPDLVLGDFDSLPPDLATRLAADGIPHERVPAAKDETDTHLALRAALDRGADELVLLGAVGSRLDHSLANVLLLPGLPPGVRAVLVDEQNILRLLPPGGSLRLTGRPGDFISLLPLSPEVTGIAVSGLRYDPAGRLGWGESRGVSNELTGTAAEVRTTDGWLLVIQARD